MDMLIKAESEKNAKKEFEYRRKLRLLQVRKQTTDWTINTRAQYAAKKSDQVQKIVTETASRREEEATEVIKEMTREHAEGMYQIGSAHRAAELINQLNLPQKELVEKIQRSKTVFKRHISALRSKRENNAKEFDAKERARKLKEEVRQKEDLIAKELVITRTYQVPVTILSGKGDGKEEKIYPASPIKYLNVPGAQKSPRKKRRTKRGVSKENKTPAIQKPKTPPSSLFGIVASERAAGSTPPVIMERDEAASSRVSRESRTAPASKGGGVEPVTYFDASIPLPPVRYMAPANLVQPVSQESVKSNAWLEGEKLNEEAERIEEKRLADLREMERRAQIRGQKALRIAKLEQRYKQLEADLLEKDQVQGFQPVLDSENRNSLLGLEDPEDANRPDTITQPDETDRHVELPPTPAIKKDRPTKQKQKSPFTISSPVPPPRPEKIYPTPQINGSSSSSWANSIHTLSTLSSLEARDIPDVELEDDSTSTTALLEIAYPEGIKSSNPLLPVITSTESSLSDVLGDICMQQRMVSQGSPFKPGRKNGHLKRHVSSYNTTSGRMDRTQPSVQTSGSSGSPSSWSTCFRTLSSLETSEITSSGESKEESSSSSTMAVLEVLCSPGRDSRFMHYLLHSTTDSSLSDALNNLRFQQETLHWSSTVSTTTSTNSSKEEKPERPLSLGSSGSASNDTSSLIRVTKRMVRLLEKENACPMFEAPSSCSSIKLNTSSSSSKSKETNRGTFGTNLGNTLLSSSVQSEQQPISTLSFPLPAAGTSAIQKLANEWTSVSIEKPPWWQA